MKRFLLLMMICGISLSMLTGLLQVAHAQTPPPMDDAHIGRIKASCMAAKTTLSRVHESDALLRVNRGQVYESVSTKLMANLNSRIALNRMDGSNLIKIANQYEHELVNFRNDYQVYEQQLSQTLGIDCQKQPVAFYDAVTTSRTKRATVHQDVVNINQQATAYQAAFEQFAVQSKADSQQVGN